MVAQLADATQVILARHNVCCSVNTASKDVAHYYGRPTKSQFSPPMISSTRATQSSIAFISVLSWFRVSATKPNATILLSTLGSETEPSVERQCLNHEIPTTQPLSWMKTRCFSRGMPFYSREFKGIHISWSFFKTTGKRLLYICVRRVSIQLRCRRSSSRLRCNTSCTSGVASPRPSACS